MTEKDLYPQFCNDFFYREKTSNVPDTHTIEKAGVTMTVSTIPWQSPGVPLDGDAYVTLFPKDLKLNVNNIPGLQKTVPLVCLGSSDVKYLQDMSGHSHVRIEPSFPNLFEWLAGIFSQSDRQSYKSVLEIRESLAASITPEKLASSIEALAECIIRAIHQFSREDNTLIAKYNTLRTNVRDDCGLSRVHPEAYDKLCSLVYERTNYCIHIDKKGWYCIEHDG